MCSEKCLHEICWIDYLKTIVGPTTVNYGNITYLQINMNAYNVSKSDIINSTELQENIIDALTIASRNIILNSTSNETNFDEFMAKPVLYSIEQGTGCGRRRRQLNWNSEFDSHHHHHHHTQHTHSRKLHLSSDCLITPNHEYSKITVILKFNSLYNRVLWEAKHDAIRDEFETKLGNIWYHTLNSTKISNAYVNADFIILDSSSSNGITLPTGYPTNSPTVGPSEDTSSSEETSNAINKNENTIRLLTFISIGLGGTLVCIIVVSIILLIKQRKTKQKLDQTTLLLQESQLEAQNGLSYDEKQPDKLGLGHRVVNSARFGEHQPGPGYKKDIPPALDKKATGNSEGAGNDHDTEPGTHGVSNAIADEIDDHDNDDDDDDDDTQESASDLFSDVDAKNRLPAPLKMQMIQSDSFRDVETPGGDEHEVQPNGNNEIDNNDNDESEDGNVINLANVVGNVDGDSNVKQRRVKKTRRRPPKPPTRGGKPPRGGLPKPPQY